jgi:predicted N-acyltransferase
MHTEVFSGIKNVDQAFWDEVTQGYAYAGWRWCHYGEAVNRLPGYYAVVHNGGGPIGGAIFSIMYADAVPTLNKFVSWFLRLYLKRRPLIACRTAVTTDHKGMFLPDDPKLREQVIKELQGVALDITHQHNGSFFVADYFDEHEMDYAWGKFHPITDFSKAGTQMIVKWETWDEFMQALRASSKKNHKNVRHNTRYAQELGITVKFGEAPPVKQVLDLIKKKMDKYDVQFEPQRMINVIEALPRLADQQYTWVTAEQAGKIIACEVLLFDEVNRVSKTTLYGRDYDVPYVYFYLAYEDIRYAIEEFRAKTIIYDTDAYEFKRRVGFVDDPRNNLVFYPGSVFERGLASILMRFMND